LVEGFCEAERYHSNVVFGSLPFWRSSGPTAESWAERPALGDRNATRLKMDLDKIDTDIPTHHKPMKESVSSGPTS
jgi:hypothetical protein